MSEPRLILVKHAMPAIDPALPSAQWPLSEGGRAAAAALAEKVRPLAPQRLAASTEPKAEETAIAMALVLGLPVTLDPSFVEHRRPQADFGDREAFEAKVKALFDRPSERAFGAESADEAHARFTTALTVHRMDPSPLMVVSHGTVIT
ncbi:MAG TPA: histidine phosphatase family protein, partial [Caulobacteraceae bacterium]|nr:histidine phosphatase family protein [Caulobacteraceae bacterium]